MRESIRVRVRGGGEKLASLTLLENAVEPNGARVKLGGRVRVVAGKQRGCWLAKESLLVAGKGETRRAVRVDDVHGAALGHAPPPSSGPGQPCLGGV